MCLKNFTIRRMNIVNTRARRRKFMHELHKKERNYRSNQEELHERIDINDENNQRCVE